MLVLKPIRPDLLQGITEVIEALDRFLAAIRRTKKERQLHSTMRKLEKALQVAFREQGRLFLKEFEQLKGRFPKEELREADYPGWWLDFAEWWPFLEAAMMATAKVFMEPIDEAVMAALLMGGQTLIAELQLPLTFSLSNPRAVAYLREYGAKLVTQINETTKEYIHNVLVQGSEEGWSYDKVAKAITDRYEEFAVGRPQEHIRSRAHLIAVTETGNAYEEGNFEAAMELHESGLEMEKYWNNVGDDRVSDGCLANTAVGWIPITQAFESGDMHPLRFPGCRCAALYRRRTKGT